MNQLMTFEHMYPKLVAYVCVWCERFIRPEIVDRQDKLVTDSWFKDETPPRNDYWRCSCNKSTKAYDQWKRAGMPKHFPYLGQVNLYPNGQLSILLENPLTFQWTGAILLVGHKRR